MGVAYRIGHAMAASRVFFQVAAWHAMRAEHLPHRHMRADACIMAWHWSCSLKSWRNNAGSGLAKSDRLHVAVRARSSLPRHSGKAATLKALRKLKGCLCASSPPEEQLPLFQIHCTDFRRSMDAARAQVRVRVQRLCGMRAVYLGKNMPESCLDRATLAQILDSMLHEVFL